MVDGLQVVEEMSWSVHCQGLLHLFEGRAQDLFSQQQFATMRHTTHLISPVEALRFVFCPEGTTSKSTRLIFLSPLRQQRSASSTSDRSFRPTGAGLSHTFIPPSDRGGRNREDNKYSNGSRPPRSFGPNSTNSNNRPPEDNDRSWRTPLPRSFGLRPDSRDGSHLDRNRDLPSSSFRSFIPRSNHRNQLREDDARSSAPPPSQVFGPRSLQDGHPHDEAIRSKVVRLVSADNKLQEPSFLRDILASIDRRTHFVQQVSTLDGTDMSTPICKIIDKKEKRDQERARAKAVKSNQHAGIAKKLELSWGIGKHDLEHRMKKVREFLEEGRRVEIVVGASRRKGQAKKAAKIEAEEAAETFKAIREALAGIEDMTEWKPMDGSIGRMATLYLEAKSKRRKVDKAGESLD